MREQEAATDCPSAQVLIVDRSEDCREVLRTMLRRRGVGILEAAEARHGLALLQKHRPAVVVLDSDTESADDELVQQCYSSDSRDSNAALVVLGHLRSSLDRPPNGRILSKPYHFAPLIRTIERLLDQKEGAISHGIPVCDSGPRSRKAV